jgi:hypothetical protein
MDAEQTIAEIECLERIFGGAGHSTAAGIDNLVLEFRDALHERIERRKARG